MHRQKTEAEERQVENIMSMQRTPDFYASATPEERSLALGVALAQHTLVNTTSPFVDDSPITEDTLLDRETAGSQAMRAAIGNAVILSKERHYDMINDITTGILSDINSQAYAQHILKGIENPEHRGTLTETMQRIVGYAADDQDVKYDLENQAAGQYHKLDPYAQKDIMGDMNGTNLPKDMRSKGVLGDKLLDSYGDRDSPYVTAMRLAGHDEKAIDRVHALLTDGTSTGHKEADLVITTVHERIGAKWEGYAEEHTATHYQREVKAGARLLGYYDRGQYMSEANAASMMLTDMGVMEEAERHLNTGMSVTANRSQTKMIAAGDYHKLNEVPAEVVAAKINARHHLAPADIVFVARDIERKKDEEALERERELHRSPDYTPDKLKNSLQSEIERVTDVLNAVGTTGSPVVDHIIIDVFTSTTGDIDSYIRPAARLLHAYENETPHMLPEVGKAVMLADKAVIDQAIANKDNPKVNPEQNGFLAKGEYHRLDHSHAQTVADRLNTHAFKAPASDEGIVANSPPAQKAQQHAHRAMAQQAAMGM